MSDFDPAAYLAKKREQAAAQSHEAFDPHSYLMRKRGGPVVSPDEGASFARKAGATAQDAVESSTSLGAGIIDPVTSAIGAAGSYLVPYTEGHFFDPSTGAKDSAGKSSVGGSGMTLGERFESEMANRRASRKLAQERSPLVSTAASLLPAVLAPQVLAELPAFSGSAASMSMPVRAAAGAADALAYTAANKFGSNLDRPGVALDEAGKSLSDPGVALGGAAMPMLAETFPAVADPAKKLSRWLLSKALPKVQPTAAAEALMREGVPLTVGQMNPDSTLGKLEEVATGTPFAGPGITQKRGDAQDAWRGRVIGKALPPGMDPVTGTTEEQLAAAYGGFGNAYAPVKGKSVVPQTPTGETLREAFARSTSNPNILADDNARQTVARFLENQASVAKPHDISFGDTSKPENLQAAVSWLEQQRARMEPLLKPLPGSEGTNPGSPGRALMAAQKAPPPTMQTPPPEPVTSDALLAMRSNVRGAIRKAESGGRKMHAELMGDAEQAITDTLASQLDKKAAAQLGLTDAQYAKFKTVEAAAGRGGPEGNFTPRQLATQVRDDLGTARYVRGDAGDLQDLAQHGSAVFDARTPKTGWATLANLPGGKFVTGAAASWMNSPSGRALLLRQPPTASPDLGQLLMDPAIQARIQGLARLQAIRGQPLPTPGQRWLLPVAARDDQEDQR